MPNTDFIRQVGAFRWFTRYAVLLTRKRIFKLESRMRLPTGGTIALPIHSRSATEVFVTNANVDWGSEALFSSFADPKRDFLDIGSHIGYYSVYLSPRVRAVYAFEPDPRNLKSLRENAELAGNVEVLEMAVSSSDGVANLGVGSASTDSGLTDEAAGKEVIEVRVTSIDSFFSSRPGLDVALIKIDAEGYDLQVLYGMQRLAAEQQPLILTECDLSADLRALCHDWRYKIYAFVRDRKTMGTSFRAMGVGSEQLWYKMLFLVPSHLQPDFQRRIQ